MELTFSGVTLTILTIVSRRWLLFPRMMISYESSSLESCDLHVAVFGILTVKVILAILASKDFSMENLSSKEGRS